MLDQFRAEFWEYKEKVVEPQNIIAHITGRLLKVRRALKETQKAWKRKELTSDIFKFLNFTLSFDAESSEF